MYIVHTMYVMSYIHTVKFSAKISLVSSYMFYICSRSKLILKTITTSSLHYLSNIYYGSICKGHKTNQAKIMVLFLVRAGGTGQKSSKDFFLV